MRRLNAGIVELPQSSLANILVLESSTWIDDTLSFRAHAMALTWEGQIRVSDDVAELNIPLQWYLLPLSSTIEALIRTHGAELFEDSDVSAGPKSKGNASP